MVITDRRLYLTPLLMIILSCQLNAQCTTTGPNSPAVGGNDPSIGTIAFGSPSGALSSNDAFATATALALGDITNYLTLSDFGFSIPSNATICGIRVEIERSATGILQSVQDNEVKLIKGGVISGDNKAVASTWPETDAYQSYGGSSDLWGVSWSPSDINASNFGIALSVNLSGISALPTANVDHMRMSVDYAVPLPIELIDFNAFSTEHHTVSLTWSTASETNNEFFTVERSPDGRQWTPVLDYPGAGNSSYQLDYKAEDPHPVPGTSYYRLKQTDFDGTFTYSEIERVRAEAVPRISIWPNPASEALRIDFVDTETKIELRNIQGVLLPVPEARYGSSSTLDLSGLEPGVYFVELWSGNTLLRKRIAIR